MLLKKLAKSKPARASTSRWITLQYIVADDKKFGAFITYYFSRDLDKFSQQQAQDAVATVRETLTALGYSVCDEYKDGSEPGGRLSDQHLSCPHF